MGYDGKILARVRDIIASRKQVNEAELKRRKSVVYNSIPAIIEAEAEITRLMVSVSAEALKSGSDAGKAVENARISCEKLLDRRSALLKSGGYPTNYIDEIYDCPICRDTGYVLGEPCTCLKKLYSAEAVKELSSTLNINGQCFDKFDLSYYDDVFDTELNDTPRAVLSATFSICREYATDFGSKSVNLLFRGGTGLGKTFLAASVAKVVSEKGFSVVYDTAISVMEAFELQKFDRGGEGTEETASRVRRYTECDLLIIDDLGTEMTTTFTQSALYSLVNGRLLKGGKTIITTNLSEDELRRRYSPQIVSRLEGEYLPLKFAGRDIRTIKRAK